MKQWTLAVFVVILFLAVHPAYSGAAEKAAPRRMTDVVVTATRTEQQLDKVGGSAVTVISSDDIDARHQTTISEVLKSVPGMDIINNGGPGTNTSVFLRGADSKNTLILIDGMMFNDPSHTNRSANIANLLTDAIARIEVVRGPMSVLYGSNATAGVVNIITKTGHEKPSLQATVEGGAYGTWKYAAGLQGAVDAFDFSLMGTTIQTDGFSVANDDNPDIPHAGNTGEKDGWKNNSFYGRFGMAVAPDVDIEANFLYFDAETDLDDWNWFAGYSGDRFDTDPLTWLPVPAPDGVKKHKSENSHAAGKVTVRNAFFNRRFSSALSFNASRTESTNDDADGNEWFDYKGKTREWAWQGGFTVLKSHVISLGATYFQEEMESDSDGITDADADTKSVWLQDQMLVGDSLVLVAGVRNDNHENFGNQATFRFSPAYTVDGTTIKASYGTGFRAPSLYELFSAFGNEDLEAEESYGWDVGVEQVIGGVTLGATYFALTFDNRIDWDPNRIIPGMPWPGGYNQLDGKTKTSGVEAFIAARPCKNLAFALNYTYTDTEDPDGTHLVRRPYNKIFINTRYDLSENAQVNADILWMGERDAITTAMDENGNPVENLDAYTVVNIAARYDLTDNFQLFARIDNLFDEFYEEAWSYATPGRSGYAGLKMRY